MAAYDNVSLPGAPDIAHAGNYAQMLMQGLSSLPDAYYKGQEQRYQQRQRDFFQDPDNQKMLDDAIKSGSYGPLLKSMIQQGGTQAAGSAIPILQKQPFLDAALQDIKSGNNAQPWWMQGGAPSPAASNPSASGPANIGPTRGQPQLSATGSDSAGAETVRSMTAAMANGRNVSPAVMANLAKAVGAPDPDAPLTGAQETRLRQVGGTYFRGSMGPAQAAAGGPIGGGPPSQPGPTAQPGAATPGGAPGGASGGPGFSPTPGPGPAAQGPPAAPQAAPAAGPPASFNDRFGAAMPSPPAGAAPVRTVQAQAADPAADLVPRGFRGDSRDFAAAARIRADALRRQANTGGIVGIPSKAKEDQAAALDKQANEIDEAWRKASELTQEQKNTGAVRGGPPAEALKHEIESGQKEFDSINELGDNARQSSQKLRIAQTFVNSDEYYSGPVEQLNRKFKQWAATFGGDPNAGTPQEAMVKSINDLLAEQVRAMAKSGVGRVLMTEVQTMRDSIASQKITPATNRLLLEEVARVHRAQMEIQDAANAYQQQHGHLDAGFRKIVADYYRDRPLFTDAEIHDPRLIAPPVAPPGLDATAAKQWAKSRGLSPGDPVRTQDGRIVAAP